MRHTTVMLPLLAGLALLPAAEPLPVPAGADHPRGYVALKTSVPPKIDGKLDDECWKAAPWSEEFVDIEGDKKPKPAHRTRMKMLWDDKALYIAAELTEPHVWATLTEHDSVIFQDPDFEVFIDPDGDSHDYAELELNAKNTTWDLLLTKPYKDGGRAINGWEIIGLKTGVHIDGTLNDPSDRDTGWTVEIAWPWVGLGELMADKKSAPPKDGDQWRINFSRVEWDFVVKNGKYEKLKKPEHNWVWSPQGVIDMHRPERWGYVQFSEKAAGPVAFVPDPRHPVKMLLHEIYYAQHAHHRKHGKYLPRVADLGVPKSALGTPEMEVSSFGFEAKLKSGKETWVIGADARIRNVGR